MQRAWDDLGGSKIAERSGPLRIWMADDDPNDHLFMTLASTEAGLDAEFTFVKDGSLLLFRLAELEHEADHPDLIVLDLRMPGLNGHRTLEELQTHPTLWAIPVVVFSSSTRPTDRLGSFERGARWYETKPSDFPGMVEFARSLPARTERGHDRSGAAGIYAPLSKMRLTADTIGQVNAALELKDWPGQ